MSLTFSLKILPITLKYFANTYIAWLVNNWIVCHTMRKVIICNFKIAHRGYTCTHSAQLPLLLMLLQLVTMFYRASVQLYFTMIIEIPSITDDKYNKAYKVSIKWLFWEQVKRWNRQIFVKNWWPVIIFITKPQRSDYKPVDILTFFHINYF